MCLLYCYRELKGTEIDTLVRRAAARDHLHIHVAISGRLRGLGECAFRFNRYYANSPRLPSTRTRRGRARARRRRQRCAPQRYRNTLSLIETGKIINNSPLPFSCGAQRSLCPCPGVAPPPEEIKTNTRAFCARWRAEKTCQTDTLSLEQ